MRKFSGFGFVFCGLILAGLPALASAADDASSGRVTFTKDVLPILQQNCQICHRTNGQNSGGVIAPMALIDFDEVRPWAKSIAKAVANREMPPWLAAPEFDGIFVNELVLTSEEIETLVKWASTGATRGDAADAPEPRVFPSEEWSIGEPDLVVALPEPYWVTDDLEDLNKSFTTALTDAQLPTDRWIKAVEFKGGSTAVHHIIGYAVPPSEPGSRTRGWMVGGIAPGDNPDRYPEGYGILLPKGSDIRFSMHYHKEPGPGTGSWDQSKIAFKFYGEDESVKPVHIGNASNGGFEIPAGHGNWPVGAARTFDQDVRLVTLMPHMHLRGKDAKYTAFYPDGTSELLLDVPSYRFDWQTTYMFREPKRIPAGTRIEVKVHFDNSVNNEANPNPAESVRYGASTTEEMMIGWMSWMEDEEGEGSSGD